MTKIMQGQQNIFNTVIDMNWPQLTGSEKPRLILQNLLDVFLYKWSKVLEHFKSEAVRSGWVRRKRSLILPPPCYSKLRFP